MRLKNLRLFGLECVSQRLTKMMGLKCGLWLAVVVADDVVTAIPFEYAYEALAAGVLAAVVGSHFAVSEL